MLIIFLDRMYFTSNDESQNTFIYQPTLDRTKTLFIFLLANQMEYMILSLSHYILLSYIT